jgi:hypothetical protein
VEPKSDAYKRGFWEMVVRLKSAKHDLDRKLLNEYVWYHTQKALMNVDPHNAIALDYCEGVLAVIDLYEKTGIIPS